MTAPEPASIELQDPYKSLGAGLTWENIPGLAVLTGKNGVGKSQLVQVLAGRMRPLGEVVQGHHRAEAEAVKARVAWRGARYTHQEVFYATATWQAPPPETAVQQQVVDAIQRLQTLLSQNSGEIVEQFASATGLGVDTVRALTAAEVEERVTPLQLWRLERHSRPFSFLFLAHRLLSWSAAARAENPETTAARLGPEPWLAFDEVLASAGLPYVVVPPPEIRRTGLLAPAQTYTPTLKHTAGGPSITFDALSSGEQVLITAALWLYQTETVKHQYPYRLLLLDEPDAHLHPSMTRQFLQILLEVFVQRRGVRVIMTSHSPSTVAVAPEGSLFVMSRSGTPRIQLATTDAAIAVLSDGFLAVHESMRIVLCEDAIDAKFFQKCWERLVDEPGPSLQKLPGLLFVSGHGKANVLQIVPEMRSLGLTHFYGLIDHDTGNRGGDGVHVLQRHELENYLFDPILAWCLMCSDGYTLPVPGLQFAGDQWAHVKSKLRPDQLQAIANSLLSKLLEKMPTDAHTNTALQVVEFVDSIRLEYPLWFLQATKEELKEAYAAAFEHKVTKNKDNHKELLRIFSTVGLIPTELRNIFTEFQRPRA